MAMDEAAIAHELTALRTQVEQLVAAQAELAKERDAYKQLYVQMLEHCRKLELGLLGQKAERLSPNDAQLSLQVLGALLATDEVPQQSTLDLIDEEIEPTAEVAAHKRRKAGRKPLPEHLPRIEVEVLPPEVQAEGTDAFERIGEETCETIERRPASVVVVRVVRGKFVRKDRERNAPTEVLIGGVPDLPIERGLAGPGMLADTIVRRWDDHCPLNRLEQIYAREGIELLRSTMSGWHMRLEELVRPLIEGIRIDALASPVLCVDATGVLVREVEKCRRAHFWVVVAPERHVLFRFSAKHDSAAVDSFLRGYEGYLVADAHLVYDHLYADGKVKESGCWAHNRRYYYKALESDPERARKALAMIGALFRIERKIAGMTRAKREKLRREKSTPVVDAFYAWCDAEAQHVLDETPISKAIGYSLNQRVALRRFLEDGRLPVHNNMSELQLRREAIGRKNWLFVGNDEAAEANCAFVSLIASCKLHRIEPWAYLRDIFCLLPRWPAKRVLELAPLHWPKTREHEHTRQLLDANIFRRATLMPPAGHPPDG
jgi:transposase